MPASVICGVTLRVSTASLNCTRHRVVRQRLDRDLDALLDLGRLVVLGRHLRRRQQAPAALPLERRQRHVEVEAAQDVAHRDADAGVEGARGQVDGVAAAGGADPGRRGEAARAGVVGRDSERRSARRRRSGRSRSGRCWLVVLPNWGIAAAPKPHWIPRSRVKLRVVTTIRASISTWGVAVSSSPIRPLGLLARSSGRSRMMMVFVRVVDVDLAASRHRLRALQDGGQRRRPWRRRSAGCG